AHQHLSLSKSQIRPIQNILSLSPQRRDFPSKLEELDHQRVQLLSEKVLTSLSDVPSLSESNQLHPGRTSTGQNVGHFLVILPAILRKPLLDCRGVYPLQFGFWQNAEEVPAKVEGGVDVSIFIHALVDELPFEFISELHLELV